MGSVGGRREEARIHTAGQSRRESQILRNLSEDGGEKMFCSAAKQTEEQQQEYETAQLHGGRCPEACSSDIAEVHFEVR